jgi:hypothetical protein
MSDTRFSILDTRHWMLDAGCWMLDAGCWMLDASSQYSTFMICQWKGRGNRVSRIKYPVSGGKGEEKTRRVTRRVFPR